MSDLAFKCEILGLGVSIPKSKKHVNNKSQFGEHNIT